MKKRKHPWARYRELAGFTQESAAASLGVTRHYVIRLEQSLFWHPPDSLLVKLGMLYGCDLDEFEMGYYNYVREQREVFAKTHKSFGEFFQSESYKVGRLHPLASYRRQYELSRMGLCKALCLHYDPISDYEHNKHRDVPEQLKNACDEMNWDWSYIATAVAKWRSLGYADK